MLRIVFVINLIIGDLHFCFAQNGCVIPFPKKDDRFEPLLLNKNASTISYPLPINGAIKFTRSQVVGLFCSGNELMQTNKDTNFGACVRETTLKVDGLNYEFDEFKCKQTVKGKVLVSNTNCGRNEGKLMSIGYKIDKKWLNIIKVCYNQQEANPLYTEHVIHGEAIQYASRQKYRPYFREDGTPQELEVNNLYKQKSQKTTFLSLFGSQQIVDKYISKTSFLTRGHLAPDADFLYSSLQFITYYFVNVCPQWEIINRGNWLGIEHMVRRVAKNYNESLVIFTGTYEILTLPDRNNNPVEIYLDDSNKMVPVPKFNWKIVYSKNSKKGIALILINNPFISLTAKDVLCENICPEYGWHHKRWADVKKGFVYCCDVRVLQKIITSIPKIPVIDVLRAK